MKGALARIEENTIEKVQDDPAILSGRSRLKTKEAEDLIL
jgi:hypothetical protein